VTGSNRASSAGVPSGEPLPGHVDVLVVGAGLSGVGMAARLLRDFPRRTLAVVEARQAMGGTWDLFRYPGVRSDSDMSTLGYADRPWRDRRSIAPGAAIRDYVRDTADETGVAERVRYGHRVVAADWSSADARWTVEIDVTAPPAGGAGGASDGSADSAGSAGSAGSPASWTSPAPSCTRSTGPPTSTSPADGSSSSGRARPRSPSCRRSPSRPST